MSDDIQEIVLLRKVLRAARSAREATESGSELQAAIDLHDHFFQDSRFEKIKPVRFWLWATLCVATLVLSIAITLAGFGVSLAIRSLHP
jgi:hypothetical protein